MPSIRELIRNIDQLPSMPSVITELIELTSNPDANLDGILDLIEKDQALTAKLLKLCNSSYYGLSKQVSTLRNAVVLLGFKTVYKMVIALGTSVFFRKDAKGYGLSGIDMWRHSLGCAISAEIVANGFAPDKAPAAYTAGLLHDIGKLVLSEYVENELESILRLVESGKTFIEAEQEIIGMDHGLIGGKLARQWKFPNHLIEAIKYHHEPHLASSDEDLVAFTHIGNITSNAICAGLGVDSFSNSLSQKVFKRYKLDESAMEDIMQIAAKQIQDAETLISNLVENTA
jgi:putative nucleotidyltransferase with HDIG domain